MSGRADCPGSCQSGFEYLHRWRAYNLSISLFQHLITVTVKEFSVLNFMGFILCQLPPVVLLGITEKSLAPSSPFPSIRYVYILITNPFFMVNSPSSFSLSSYKWCFSPLMTFVALCWTHSSKSIFCLFWGVQNWTQYSDVLLMVSRDEGSSLDLLATLPNSAQDSTSFLCNEDIAGSCSACWPSITRGPSLQSCLPASYSSVLVPGVIPPKMQVLTFPFAAFHETTFSPITHSV